VPCNAASKTASERCPESEKNFIRRILDEEFGRKCGMEKRCLEILMGGLPWRS
jgi:hypothetical protein